MKPIILWSSLTSAVLFVVLLLSLFNPAAGDGPGALLILVALAGMLGFLIVGVPWVLLNVGKKYCPHCRSRIPMAATRCPRCTSEIPPDLPSVNQTPL